MTLDGCNDINKSCKLCANSKIDYWDEENNYHCSFECTCGHYKNAGTIIGFLEKHNCKDFKEVVN